MNRILVVEDHPMDRRLIRSILTREGFDVIEAADGTGALEQTRAAAPDLILLDVGLPDISGYEVCAELREHLSTSDIPIVFCSGMADRSDVARGLEKGAADFVGKPIEPRELLARVRTHLRIRHLNVSLQAVNDDLLRLSNELMEKQQRIEEDLKAAAAIQSTLIPQGDGRIDGVELASSFMPCDNVGGDIFNYFPLSDGRVALYIVDVTGHGVSSAMVTVSVAQSLAPHGGVTVEDYGKGAVVAPGEVLRRLDDEYPLERFERPFTIFYGILDRRSGVLEYSAAAHPPAVVQRPSGEVTLLEEGGPVIGMGCFLGFDEGRHVLEPGDRLFLFTDGIVEHEGPGGELFGQQRLVEALGRGREASLSEVCASLMRELHLFGQRRPPRDDVSLLALEIAASAEGGEG